MTFRFTALQRRAPFRGVVASSGPGRWLSVLCALMAFAAGPAAPVSAQAGAQGQTKNSLLGEIEMISINNLGDPWSGGWIRVGGQDFILPRNLLIDLPANRLSLSELYQQAPPACVALGQTGLAKADTCMPEKRGAYVTTMNANKLATGQIVVGEIWIDKGIESLEGVVSYINYDEGYFRINGVGNEGGTLVRINDPGSRHTIQVGRGCLAGSENCSADPRFTIDDVNYMVAATTGYPMCIPSTRIGVGTVRGTAGNPVSNAAGSGDAFCPQTNRTTNPVTNSTRFAPIRVGDHILVEGNFELINGTRFLSAWHVNVHVALATRNTPDQPDYMVWDEVEWDAPGFNNGRARMLMIGFTTLPASQLDVYTLRVNPTTGEYYQDPVASTVGNPDSTIGVGFAGNGSIFKFQYDVDFTAVTKQEVRRPCPVLANAGFSSCTSVSDSAQDFSRLSPITREIIGVTRHPLNPGVVARDINGEVANFGNYLTPIGIGHPEFAEIDLGALMTPFIFEGEPWNWDRRLSPGGCLDTGCDSTPQPLDPFPSSGHDPRLVLSGGGTPPPVPDRIFTYFTPTGNTITHPNGIELPQLTAHLLAGYPASTTPAPGTLQGPSPFPPIGDGTPAPAATATVPNLSGSASLASSAITASGLSVGAITTANSATIVAGNVVSQNPAAGAIVAPLTAVDFVISIGPAAAAPVAVPNVVNLTQANATTAITGATLTLGAVTNASSATVAAGSVISQNPAAGASVAPGSAVALVVSTGPAVVNVTVPNVVNLTQANATTAITGATLTLGAVTNASSATVAAGSVISQNPAAGASVAPGSAVALVVSTGPAPAAPAVIATAISDGIGTRTTGAFSAPAGAVLVAFASSDGPNAVNSQTLTISGAGLTWTRVQRSATRRGDAEIWTATAAAALTNVTVTSTPTAGGFQQSLTVLAFTGVSGIGASASVGAVGTTAASASLVTQAAGSVVYAAGSDWSTIAARTVPAGQTKVRELVTPGLSVAWVQTLNGVTGAAGSTVTLNTTAPTSPEWNMAIVELKR